MARSTIPQPLQLTTLSGVYEAAREIVRLSSIETCSTYDRTAQRLKALATNPRSREDLIRFHAALDKLAEASATLGQTALIAPADHPLVVRHEMKMKGVRS